MKGTSLASNELQEAGLAPVCSESEYPPRPFPEMNRKELIS